MIEISTMDTSKSPQDSVALSLRDKSIGTFYDNVKTTFQHLKAIHDRSYVIKSVLVFINMINFTLLFAEQIAGTVAIIVSYALLFITVLFIQSDDSGDVCTFYLESLNAACSKVYLEFVIVKHKGLELKSLAMEEQDASTFHR